MANCMQLEIVTPDKLLFSSDEIVYLGLRTNDGGIGIEANHIPVIASLDIAPMKYRSGRWHRRLCCDLWWFYGNER